VRYITTAILPASPVYRFTHHALNYLLPPARDHIRPACLRHRLHFCSTSVLYLPRCLPGMLPGYLCCVGVLPYREKLVVLFAGSAGVSVLVSRAVSVWTSPGLNIACVLVAVDDGGGRRRSAFGGSSFSFWFLAHLFVFPTTARLPLHCHYYQLADFYSSTLSSALSDKHLPVIPFPHTPHYTTLRGSTSASPLREHMLEHSLFLP